MEDVLQYILSSSGAHVARASRSECIQLDIILLLCYQLCFPPLVFDSSLFQPSASFSHLFCSSHYFTLPFPFCTMKFSFHPVCHLDMAYELCISLSPDLHLLTRFPSLLPAAAARVSQRRSDKIRPLTLLFVFTLTSLSLLRPVVVSLLPVCSARRTQSGILWFFMWREWSRGWLGGCEEALIKALVCLNAFLLSL